MNPVKIIILLLSFSMYSVCDNAQNIFVSTVGSDTAAGTMDAPVRTIQRAADMARAGDTVWIRAGTYRETVSPARNGTSEQPIVFCAYPREAVIISGGDLLTVWTDIGGGIWAAPMQSSMEAYRNQLFVNGKSMTKARWPNITDDDPLTPEGGICDQPNCSMSQIRVQGGFPGTWNSTSLAGASVWVMAQSKWRAWNSPVQAYDPATGTVTVNEITESWYTTYMNPGNPVPHNYGVSYIILSGSRGLLDAAGEWWFDQANNQVLIIPPSGMVPGEPEVGIEAKQRDYGFILNQRSHIQVLDIRFRGTAISMKESEYCVLRGLNFYEFDYREGAAPTWYRATGVIVSGSGNVVRDCEFSRCTDAGVTLLGRNNSMVNCYLHEMDYGGHDGGPINLGGQGHLVSHNTVERTSRKGINPHGLSHLIQYNLIKEVGLVNRDQAAVFAGGFDAGNTVIRFNWVNVSNGNPESMASGIYMDNWHQNVLVHHNIIWNTSQGLICNRPGNYDVWAHNTMEGTIRTSYGPWIGMETLHGTLIHNNWATGDIDINNYCWSKRSNRITGINELNISFDSGFPVPNSNPGGEDGATILPGINDGYLGESPDIGVIENGELNWTAGHDFDHPPEPVYEQAFSYYRNYVINGSFDYARVDITPGFDKFHGWTRTGLKASTVEYFPGFNYPAADQRNSIHGNSLHLKGTDDDGVEQSVMNLPKGRFILSAYVRLVDPVSPGADVNLSIYQGDEKVAGRWASSVTLTGSQKWRMVKVPFPNPSEGTVTVRITKQGNGEAYIDNVGLMPFYSDNPFDITLDTSDIVIKILDGNSQKAVPNCKITLNDREFISDTNGVVQLSGVISNQYSLLVEKEGYYDYSNDAVDIYSDSTIIIGLIAEHITGSIYVMDLSTGQPVYRAKITFNDSVITLSSSDGSTDFESQAGEKVSYKIEHDDYFTEEGMYMFYNDSSLVIAITPQFATVTFQITSDGEMVSASVHFNGYDYDARTGIASIYHPARQSYDYSIMKDGFDEIAGSVWLEKDTTITIELTVTHSAEKGHEGKLSVYPNPSNGRLFVEFPCIFINRYIKIVNLTGQIIHVQKADEMINEVDISNLDEAVYILRIVPLGLNRDIMFIKP